MPTYVALLRGINVSGQKKIAMADLRAALDELGYRDLRTYIQSGNLVFEHSRVKPTTLAKQIRERIREAYGYEVPTVVVPAVDLARVRDRNPFRNERVENATHCHVSFLHTTPGAGRIAEFDALSFPPEERVLDGSVVYLFLPNGAGRAKLSNNFIERKLKVSATSRNWKTVSKLCEMAGV